MLSSYFTVCWVPQCTFCNNLDVTAFSVSADFNELSVLKGLFGSADEAVLLKETSPKHNHLCKLNCFNFL